MAKTKAKAAARSGSTSRIWVLADGKVLPATGSSLPDRWTHWCKEGDAAWTIRGDESEKEMVDGKP